MKTETKTEGPRGFAVLMQQIDDGALHAEVSEAVQALCAELSEHAERTETMAKGALTLKLMFTARSNGTINIEADVATKSPKARRAGSVFWLTPSGNLSAENPRQQKLPLRQVPDAAEKAREVPIETPNVRTL